MKKIYCILILSLVLLYPNFCIDPPLVDSLDDEYIIIGSFIIHMSQITEENFNAASLTITDTQKIYYKSKFADGTWFRVDESVEIKDIILKGNSETMDNDYMDSYFNFTLMIDKDGNLIKFGDISTSTNTNSQIISLDTLIKEKNDQIAQLMFQIKGDINDSLNEAIASEIAQLNYDKSLLENFDNESASENQAIEDKLDEISKAKEDNNTKLEYELYRELEELDKSTFNKDIKLELLLSLLEDIKSLNDLKLKFQANAFDKLLEEVDLELASKNEVVDDLSSKLLEENIKDLLASSLTEKERDEIKSMTSLISAKMEDVKSNSNDKLVTQTLDSTIESVMDDLAYSIINFEAGIKMKTGDTLILDLLEEDTKISQKIKKILANPSGNVVSIIERDDLTIDIIKNKSFTLLENLYKNLDKTNTFYKQILTEKYNAKNNILKIMQANNKLLVSKFEDLSKLENLISRKEKLKNQIELLREEIDKLAISHTGEDIILIKKDKESSIENSKIQIINLDKEIDRIINQININEFIDKLRASNEEILSEKALLDIKDSEIELIIDLAREVDNSTKKIYKEELLEDPRLSDPITGFDLSTDMKNILNYSRHINALLNKNYEEHMLEILKENYYLINDYNSDKKKLYTQNLDLYSKRIKEIDLEVSIYKDMQFVDKDITYIKYKYWLAVISKNFDEQTKYLNLINEYKSLDEKLRSEEASYDLNLDYLRKKIDELAFIIEGDFN